MNSIHEICKKYRIKNYTINDDGSIDVNGTVNIRFNGLSEFPLRFNKIFGSFYCDNNELTSLKNGPNWIKGSFRCDFNELTSLEFSPKYVGGDFNCSHNPLTSNSCEIEIQGYFFTTFSEKGLIINNYNIVTNKEEWQKLIKRKRILNELYTRHM